MKKKKMKKKKQNERLEMCTSNYTHSAQCTLTQCATKHNSIVIVICRSNRSKANSRYDNPILSYKIVLIYNVFAFIYSENSKLKKHSLNAIISWIVFFPSHTFSKFCQRIYLGALVFYNFHFLYFSSFASESVSPFLFCFWNFQRSPFPNLFSTHLLFPSLRKQTKKILQMNTILRVNTCNISIYFVGTFYLQCTKLPSER